MARFFHKTPMGKCEGSLCFQYRTHKIYLTTNRETFEGQCNCGANILGELSYINNEEKIKVSSKITKGSGKFGVKYLRGNPRQEIGKELSEKKYVPVLIAS